MPSWIKSDFCFDYRCAVFLLSRRDRKLFDGLKAHEGNIDTLEAVILGIVEHHRPNLKGATLHSVSYNPCMMAWEIELSHSSLPRIRPGDILMRIPLVRDDETVSLWDDEVIKTAMAGNADKAIMVGAKE